MFLPVRCRVRPSKGRPRGRVRQCAVTVLSAGLLTLTMPTTGAAQPAHSVPDTLGQRMQACVVCHGAEGRSTNDGYFPRIAGKPAGYLYNQLRHFQAGRRINDTMSQLLEPLSPDYLREIASYFANLELPYPPPPPAEGSATERALGRRLVLEGDPARDLPACVQCHGRAMTGRLPAVPGLLGLPRDYLVAQFGAWRIGTRQAAAPDCMATIIERLTPADIGALASWLAAQPVPGAGHPAPVADTPAPLECGSLAR
ncbi:MAG: cytochrome c4 [Burkholderiaceae bacterium]